MHVAKLLSAAVAAAALSVRAMEALAYFMDAQTHLNIAARKCNKYHNNMNCLIFLVR